MSQDWIEKTEQDANKAGGGGGIVAQCELHRGYKVFITGMDNRKSFFPYTDEASKKVAKKKADETGYSNPQDSVELIVFKATVKTTKEVDGKPVSVGETWKDDRFFVDPLWTKGFKEVVLPALKEQKPPLGEKFWGKVSFAKDPSGKKKTNQQGEETDNLIAFVAKVYKDEAEAVADVGQGSNGTEPHDPNVPEGYSKELWLGSKPEIEKEISAVVDGVTKSFEGKKVAPPVIKKAIMDAKNAKVAQLAEAYAATPEQIFHLIDS